MAGIPIKPRISLNDLEEFVEDYSPAGGAMSWEESGQSIVYDVPFQYVYDAMLLLLGFAYTEEVQCQRNGDPTNTGPPIASTPPTEFTANTSNNSTYLNNVSSFNELAVGTEIFRKDTQASAGVVVGINGNNDTDISFRAIQLDTEQVGTDTGVRYQIGRNSTDPNVEKRKFLRRLLPAAHPIFPYMVCTRISNWKAVSPKGKVTSVSRLPLSTIIKNVPKYTSKYSVLRLTADYTMPPYKLALDPKYGNEIIRYFWRDQSPSASFITLDQGSMVFNEGSVVGKPFVAPGYAQPEIMQNFSYYWSHVPEDYFNTVATYTANGTAITEVGLPIRFAQALQCVNQTDFLGFKPGTLLMEPYEYERRRMPLEFTDAVPRFWVKMRINLKYFNPKYLDTTGGAVRSKFGHLTAPAGPNQYAWIVTKADNPAFAGKDRFTSYDFNSFFFPLLENQVTEVV